jgi:hypothetical protein
MRNHGQTDYDKKVNYITERVKHAIKYEGASINSDESLINIIAIYIDDSPSRSLIETVKAKLGLNF